MHKGLLVNRVWSACSKSWNTPIANIANTPIEEKYFYSVYPCCMLSNIDRWRGRRRSGGGSGPEWAWSRCRHHDCQVCMFSIDTWASVIGEGVTWSYNCFWSGMKSRWRRPSYRKKISVTWLLNMQPSKRYVCTREILYSGTPLIWTQWGKVSVLVKCPISGVKLCVLEETVSLLQRCPYLSRVLSSMFNPNPTVFILTPLKLSLSLYRRGKELRPIPAVERLRRNWKNSNSNSNWIQTLLSFSVSLSFCAYCITLCIIPSARMRSEGYISPLFVPETIYTIYPTGDEGQKICRVFSENAPLQS